MHLEWLMLMEIFYLSLLRGFREGHPAGIPLAPQAVQHPLLLEHLCLSTVHLRL